MQNRSSPSLVHLLALCGVFGLSVFLTLTMVTWRWEEAKWDFWKQGWVLSLAALTYPAMVGIAGRLAERLGRARQAAFACWAVSLSVWLLLIADPWAAAAAFALVGGISAWFFPAIAGLMADAGKETQAVSVPLHRRVAKYNMGWSMGNLLGFAIALTLAGYKLYWIGALILTLATCVAGIDLLRFSHLKPASKQTSETFIQDDPRIPRCATVGRFGILLGCIIGNIFFGMLLAVLTRENVAIGDSSQARTLQTIAFLTYAAGYVASFFLLSSWAGWILHPLRLLMIQQGSLLGGIALILLPFIGFVHPVGITIACLFLGLGYGSTYTASIYYSLRQGAGGASGAAGLHETFVGSGNVLGPVVGGLGVTILAPYCIPILPGGGLVALGILIAGMSFIILLFNLIMRPWKTPTPHR
jgi:hypothetical protein